MNILTLLSVVTSFELGLQHGDFALWTADLPYYMEMQQNKSVSTDFNVRLNFWWLYVGGGMQTPAILMGDWYKPGDYNPQKATYTFCAGLQSKHFQIGYNYACTHPVVSYLPQQFVKYKIDGGYWKVFIKYEHKFTFKQN